MQIAERKPEFSTPNVFETLRKKFDLRLISEPEEDLKRMLTSTTAIDEESPLFDQL